MCQSHAARRKSRRSLGAQRRAIVAVGGCIVALGYFAPSSSASVYTWDGTTNPADWNTASNWGGTVPTATDSALFDGTDAGNASLVTLSAASPVLGITFATGAEAYTIGSTANSTDSLNIYSGGITVNAGVTQNENIYGPMTLEASSTITQNGSGTLSLGDPTYISTTPGYAAANDTLKFASGATLTVAGTGNVTLNGPIGPYSQVSITSNSTGTLTLNASTGATSYGVGSLTVNSGTVMQGTGSPTQLGYAGSLIVNGGTFNANGTAMRDSKSFGGTGGTITNSSTANVSFAPGVNATSGTDTFAGNITGNLQFNDQGSGQTFILSGTNTFGNPAAYSNAITIADNTLTITGSWTGTGTVALNGTSSGDVGILGGNGRIDQLGTYTQNGITVGRSGYNMEGIIEPSAGTPTAGDNTLTIITPYGLQFTGGGTAPNIAHSIYECDISAAGVSDEIALTGTLSLDPTYSVLDLNALAGAFDGSTYTILTDTSRTGTFGSVEGLPSNYTVVYNPTDIQLVATAVPEPATLGLVLIGFTTLSLRRKRRNLV